MLNFHPTPNAVVVFEVEGGSDKQLDGHRKDTMPLVRALEMRGWTAEVIFYRDSNVAVTKEYVAATADAFISRINPAQYPTYTEKTYFAMCRELHLR